MSPAKKTSRKASKASTKPKAAKRPAKPKAAARKASARPAPGRAAGSAHAHCAAPDPFGDPCQNLPRRPSKYCVIHSYLER